MKQKQKTNDKRKQIFGWKLNKNWLPAYFDATRKTCIAITTNGVEIEKPYVNRKVKSNLTLEERSALTD